MKPVCQIYALALDHLDNYKLDDKYWKRIEKEFVFKKLDKSEIREKIMKKKAEVAQKILFDPIINKMNKQRKAEGQGLHSSQKQITQFFIKTS